MNSKRESIIKVTAGQTMFAMPDIDVRRSKDGSITLSNKLPLGNYPETLVASLRRWSLERPDSMFLAERNEGAWRGITYAEMWHRTRILGSRLLGAGCSLERPILILAPNSISHAELVLAAMRVGIPAAPVSTAFAVESGDLARLRYAAELITPSLAYCPESAAYDAAATDLAGLVETVVRGPAWETLAKVPDHEVELAEATVGPATIAKLLFTSGSTDKPKAVPNTHRMMCSNQAALAAIWPCVASTPPILVDWLPWNHTFGGNFCFNLVLTNGGTLYIDSGKPTPVHLAATLENLRDVAPTLYFNVPAGFEALLPHLESDPAFVRHMFSRMLFIFSAGAALPQNARDRLKAIVESVRRTSIPILTGWGSTETAPCSTALFSDTGIASNIGLPLPGTEVKLAPDQDKFELRVRGPNVMTGYWRRAPASADTFDHEGFYRMGDAGIVVDVSRPEAGIAFDGRVAENFKLRSGTWVNVGALRVTLIDAARPLIQDAVIAGHDCDEISILIFPNTAACSELVGSELDGIAFAEHPLIVERLRCCLQEHNRKAVGTSTRIARFVVLATPPLAEAHEITEKGYLNQRMVLQRRSADVIRAQGPAGHLV